MFVYSTCFKKYDDIIYENVTFIEDVNHIKKGDSFYYVYFHVKFNTYDCWLNPPDSMMGEISPTIRLKV